jgi:DnaJ like chaperone protein
MTSRPARKPGRADGTEVKDKVATAPAGARFPAHTIGTNLSIMSYWGKLLGGIAGFAVGGPFGAMVGAALGHAADGGGMPGVSFANMQFNPARVAAMLGRKDQLFAISVVVLAAKLAKVDGPVVRAEIDAFKRQFRIPPESVRDIGRLFDQARDSADGFESYAQQLGETFADNRGLLEDVLAALFAIARADKSLTVSEEQMLRQVHRLFGLDNLAWDQARGGTSRSAPGGSVDDAYAVLGLSRASTDDELRRAWLRLVRENHPDSLAARGVPQEFVARASEKVARINAAWDRIKRERGI